MYRVPQTSPGGTTISRNKHFHKMMFLANPNVGGQIVKLRQKRSPKILEYFSEKCFQKDVHRNKVRVR